MLKQSSHQKDLFPLAISSVLIESITLRLDFVVLAHLTFVYLT